jgi:sulfur-oxidizing protein SoxY
VAKFKRRGQLIKHLFISLLLSTQLFAYEKNKLITIYGYVSEKENHYIINAYHIDGKGVKDTPFQLKFDSNNTNFTVPTRKYRNYSKLKGIILDGKKIFKVSSIEKLYGKMKIKSYLNSYGKIKLIATSLMAGKEEAKLKKIEIDYITNFKVKANNHLIYNVNLSPCISEDPLQKFSYKNINPLSLTLEYTDNKGTIKTNTIKVKHASEVSKIPKELKLSESIKSYPTQIKSIKKIFGKITLIEDAIQLTAPKVAENGGSIPINIRSNLKFKSIALFIKSGHLKSKYDYYPSHFNCGEGEDFTMVSQWFATPYSIANFTLRIKMRNSGEVLVVLEAENGKFYTIRQEVEVSVGGIDAGG